MAEFTKTSEDINILVDAPLPPTEDAVQIQEIKEKIDKQKSVIANATAEKNKPATFPVVKNYQELNTTINESTQNIENLNRQLDDTKQELEKQYRDQQEVYKTGRASYNTIEDKTLRQALYDQDNSIITYKNDDMFFGLPINFVNPNLNPEKGLLDATKQNGHNYVIDPTMSNSATDHHELMYQTMPYIEIVPCTQSFAPAVTGMMRYTADGDRFTRYMSQKYGITLQGTRFGGDDSFNSNTEVKLKYAFDLANSTFSESFVNEFSNSNLQNVADNIASSGITEAAFLSGIGNFNKLTENVQKAANLFGVSDKAKSAIGSLQKAHLGLTTSDGMKGMIGNIISAGQGALFGQKFVFPQVWTSTSYNMICELKIVLMNRQPGTIEGVKRWIIGPLGLLMSFVTPQSQNGMSYQYPWLCSFKIPGIIDAKCGYIKSLAIERFGADKLDVNMLPTAVEIKLEMGELYNTFISQSKQSDDPNQIPSLNRMLSTMTFGNGNNKKTVLSSINVDEKLKREDDSEKEQQNAMVAANEKLKEFCSKLGIESVTEATKEIEGLTYTTKLILDYEYELKKYKESVQDELNTLPDEIIDAQEKLDTSKNNSNDAEQELVDSTNNKSDAETNLENSEENLNDKQQLYEDKELEYHQAVDHFGEDSPEAQYAKQQMDLAEQEKIVAEQDVNNKTSSLNEAIQDVEVKQQSYNDSLVDVQEKQDDLDKKQNRYDEINNKIDEQQKNINVLDGTYKEQQSNFIEKFIEDQKKLNDDGLPFNQNNPIIISLQDSSSNNVSFSLKNILTDPVTAVKELKYSVSESYKQTGLSDLLDSVRTAKTDSQKILSNYNQAYSELSNVVGDVQFDISNILSIGQEVKNGVYTVTNFPDELKVNYRNNVGLAKGQIESFKSLFKF